VFLILVLSAVGFGMAFTQGHNVTGGLLVAIFVCTLVVLPWDFFYNAHYFIDLVLPEELEEGSKGAELGDNTSGGGGGGPQQPEVPKVGTWIHHARCPMRSGGDTCILSQGFSGCKQVSRRRLLAPQFAKLISDHAEELNLSQ